MCWCWHIVLCYCCCFCHRAALEYGLFVLNIAFRFFCYPFLLVFCSFTRYISLRQAEINVLFFNTLAETFFSRMLHAVPVRVCVCICANVNIKRQAATIWFICIAFHGLYVFYELDERSRLKYTCVLWINKRLCTPHFYTDPTVIKSN